MVTEIVWVLSRPIDAATLESTIAGVLREDGTTARFVVSPRPGGLAVRIDLVDRITTLPRTCALELDEKRMVLRRGEAENAQAWYAIGHLALLVGRRIGAALEHEPQPALYALRGMDEPITPDTPRFEPDGPATTLFADCDTAPYPSVEPIEQTMGLAKTLEDQASAAGGYEPSADRLLTWLCQMDAAGFTVVASVLEPDTLTGQRCSEWEGDV
jgi:hypothetical protein